MTGDRIKGILDDYREGRIGLAAAVEAFRDFPTADMGYARLDTARELRVGFPEVVFCPGKTPKQVEGIVRALVGRGSRVLATRASEEHFDALRDLENLLAFDPVSCTIRSRPDAGAARSAANSAMEQLWIMCDHTTGEYSPGPDAQEADNDLAVGRIIDYISHSPIWATSAIFIEEDDAQNGVDHVDGHRSPGYIVSPYAVQYGNTDHTYYTQVNMTRTIEQILGLPPMNQFDLIASPMRTDFTNSPPPDNFLPWTHVLNQIPLDQGLVEPPASATMSPKVKALRAGWLQKNAEISAGKAHKPDSEDPDTVNHFDWYMSTGFTRPYPGEKTVRPASEFNKPAPTTTDSDD